MTPPGSDFPIRLVCLALLGAGLSSCAPNGDDTTAGAPRGPAKVRIATVTERKFADTFVALGTVKAYESTEITANVTETVTGVHFDDGQSVESDTLLAQLSDAEETAMLEGAKIALAEQQREVDRLKQLAGEGAVSQVRLQETLTARDLALSKIEEIEAQLADRRITAPFAGVLGFRKVSLGALVKPGDLIVTIDKIDRVKLDFTVPATFIGAIKPGDTIVAHSAAYPDAEFAGKVTDVGSRVDPVTRSLSVRAEIPNDDRQLRAGMLLTLTVTRDPSVSPSIPEQALVALQSRHFAFVIDDGENGGDGTTVRRVAVRIGRRVPGYVEITAGLDVGQRVVSDGLIGLNDGATVEVAGEFEGPSAAFTPGDAAADPAAADDGAADAANEGDDDDDRN